MSFRFTNNLVGVFRHRLQLEAAHRAIARRTFTGVCNGVEVTCSGFGTVLAMRLIDKPAWEQYYRPLATAAAASSSLAEDVAGVDQTVSSSSTSSTSATSTAATAGIDLERLSSSIRAATWEAMQKIRAAKTQAHHSALANNQQLASDGELRHWYAHDAISLAPHFDDGLTSELSTPWMQAMRYGVAPKAVAKETPQTPGSRRPVTVLSAVDCTPSAIPIGSAYPLFTPALFQLESMTTQAADAAEGIQNSNRSRIDKAAVVREQKKEMARDERQFWERVELIRRGQLATIPGGVKRPYASQTSTTKSDVDDKVELRFTR